MPPEREEQYTPWYKLPKEEWDALPDVLEIRVPDGYFCLCRKQYITKELLEDFRPLCEMWDRIMRRYKGAT